MKDASLDGMLGKLTGAIRPSDMPANVFPTAKDLQQRAARASSASRPQGTGNGALQSHQLKAILLRQTEQGAAFDVAAAAAQWGVDAVVLRNALAHVRLPTRSECPEGESVLCEPPRGFYKEAL